MTRLRQAIYRPLAQTVLFLTAVGMAAPDAGANVADTALETVLVTATRGDSDGSLLPIAWSVIDSDAVEFTAAQHSNQLFQRSAGTWISRNNGQESLISLRSPVFTGAGSCGSFLTAGDGIALRAPGFCNVNQLFDANLAQAGSVEVIRGPATAVYGTNAMHGVINVRSASAEMMQSRLRIDAGARDYYRALMSITLPDSRTALNAQVTTYGGYQDDSGYDQQKFTLRQDRDVDDWSLSAVFDGMNINQETAGYVQGDEVYKDEEASKKNPNPEAYRDAWSVRGHLSATKMLTESRSVTLTPYFRKNAMEFLQHFLPWQSTEKNGHQSLGIQTALRDTSENISWVVGADFDYTEGWLKETQDEPFSPNQPEGIHYDYQVDSIVYGGFIQADVQLSDHWRIDGGLRLEQTRYDYNNRTGDGDACAPTASACRFYRPADRTDNFSNISGNIALSYDLGAARVYGRLARGFRSPETAELYRLQAGQQVADLNSEEVDSFELGIRGAVSGALSYAVNGYIMRKEDVIFQDRNRQNVSGAATDHKGIELELAWQINTVWYAELAANFADHTYASATQLSGSRGDIKGNFIDTAPKHFGSARLGAESVFASVPLKAELEFIWIDQYFVDPNNENIYDGHELWNLRVDAKPSDRISIGVVLTNLADTRYAERADFGFGNFRYFVGEPRSAMLSFSYALN